MTYVQEYPVLTPLPTIKQHDKLPPSSVELGRCLDTTEAEDLYVLVKNADHLSVLISYTTKRKTGSHYYCKQFDYPLKALSWFPKALEEFRKPPADGGLHAGAMISKDVDVDGEMLAVGSTSDGYCFTNWSRQSPIGSPDFYKPTEISLSYHFLYDLGFLDLWKSLGDKYERGEI